MELSPSSETTTSCTICGLGGIGIGSSPAIAPDRCTWSGMPWSVPESVALPVFNGSFDGLVPQVVWSEPERFPMGRKHGALRSGVFQQGGPFASSDLFSTRRWITKAPTDEV